MTPVTKKAYGMRMSDVVPCDCHIHTILNVQCPFLTYKKNQYAECIETIEPDKW